MPPKNGWLFNPFQILIGCGIPVAWSCGLNLLNIICLPTLEYKIINNNGVKQLNDKVKDLLPLVSELKEKTSEDDPYKLDLEDMKPLIQFTVIEQLLKKTAQNGLGKFLNETPV